MRALIADDDRLTTTLLSDALRRQGFEVTVVHDGNAAWEHITSDPAPSLAIVDWMMPGLDGPELCRRVRQEPSRAHLYMILLNCARVYASAAACSLCSGIWLNGSPSCRK